MLGLALVGLIGFIDVITGPEFGFAFFYFIPIVPVAWLIGRWPGILVAVAAAAMWFYADTALGGPQSLMPALWNAVSRLAIFVAGAYLIDVVRQDRARMRRIDAQRDELLRVLEHELPVPAQEMIQALNAAQAQGTLDAAGIEAVRHRAESLLFLTRDFVALAQSQSRRLALRAVPFDISRLVSEVARERPDHRSVLVTVPSDALVVLGDPDRVRQALADTIAQVVSDAGAIDYVSINVRATGAEAVIAISAALPSTAKGIDTASLGLNLQLARLLLEAMNGALIVERATLGKGTRVTIRVPLASASAAAQPAALPRPE
ncbi:MAG TPA: hypothetical protein VEU77_05905 [Candidatus Acidoferrales bacterium]|nr:hypothetical protein [Candidatus Acidoferrales bacterium]